MLSDLSSFETSDIPKSVTEEKGEILPDAKKCFLAKKYLEKLQEGLNNSQSNHWLQLKELKVMFFTLLLAYCI